ncbi:phage tail protein I [Bosea minatitlanensis]|uniref:Phage tail protein I n=1 Tax=Bosea minatitlanensis TaxID=128782 RepID=A0ABW0F173_9HYPH|nr:phage tail protein I [Bosea minatitlanensis]MCT4491811.1 phage tail protein I [Bosea minatitlanensis]
MSLDLLPDSATHFERELAGLSAALDEIDPIVIETIWDAWRCPSKLLPWLAWALSVDVWDDGWAETVKRQAIADSPDYHRIKGTVQAVLSALALAERPFELTEWFDQVPLGRRGTARVFVETTLDDVGRVLGKIRPLVMSAKPKSRGIVFGAGELVTGAIAIGGGLLEESLTNVEPYAYLGEAADGVIHLGGGVLVETLTIIEGIA